jgi:hypothetical protein
LRSFALFNPRLHTFWIQAKTDTDATTMMVDVNLRRSLRNFQTDLTACRQFFLRDFQPQTIATAETKTPRRTGALNASYG